MIQSLKTSVGSLKYLVFPVFLTVAWILVIGPSPDKDGILQFYYPLLNFLEGSKQHGLNYNFLAQEFFNDAYPDGPALLAWLLSAIGLQSIILAEPYLIVLLLFAPFIPIVSVAPRRMNHLLILALFFLPSSQILLKGFSPHAFNVVYSFAGVLSFINFYRTKRYRWLLITVFFFWVSIIFKHMGALHYASFLLAYIGWQIKGKWRSWSENLTLFSVPLLAAPLYSWKHNDEYIQTTLSHNTFLNYINPTTIVIILISLVFMITVTCKIAQTIDGKIYKCKWFATALIPSAMLILSFWLWINPHSEIDALNIVLVFLGLGYLICLLYLTLYRFEGIRSFLIILTLLTSIHNTALYMSWIAKSSYLFFLPQLLVTTLWFYHSPRKISVYAYLICIITLSNFFPSLAMFESSSKLSKLASVYFEGFKSVHQNPLGWNSSTIRSMRKALQENFQKQGLKNESLYVSEGLHFHTLNALLFPENIIHSTKSVLALDAMNMKFAEELSNSWKNYQQKLFDEWAEKGMIKFLMIGADPFTSRRNQKFKISEVLANDTLHHNQFLQAFSQEYLDYLKDRNLISEYYRYVPIKEISSVKFWFHRSLSLKQPIDNTNQSNDPQKMPESARLFLLSNQYFETDPKRCLKILQEVLKLDPEHAEAQKDLVEITQRLENDVNSSISKSYLETNKISKPASE